MDCLACSKGQMKIIFSEFGKEGKDITFIDCVICNGTGKISDELNQELIEEKDSWHNDDTCAMHNGNAKYVPDNTQGALCSKHHWICVGCDKIVQVG